MILKSGRVPKDHNLFKVGENVLEYVNPYKQVREASIFTSVSKNRNRY